MKLNQPLEWNEIRQSQIGHVSIGSFKIIVSSKIIISRNSISSIRFRISPMGLFWIIKFMMCLFWIYSGFIELKFAKSAFGTVPNSELLKVPLVSSKATMKIKNLGSNLIQYGQRNTVQILLTGTYWGTHAVRVPGRLSRPWFRG